MSRYTGPKIRIIRRLGELPALTTKKVKNNYPPGREWSTNEELSEYAIRLQEKQKIRFNYGINEKQLRRYVKKAKKSRGSTGSYLLNLLEMRLDNIVLRAGLAPTIAASRQLVSHKHIEVNNKIVNIPSFQCSIGDTIHVKKSNKSRQLIDLNSRRDTTKFFPKYLEVNKDNMGARVVKTMDKQDVNLTINELLVVEFYSRKG
uniref:Small ribosomal subunit protein uS4c-1 n=1 Tax=Cyanidium caldarium TaxID=2771 RepID=RR4A_CYACA|nr:ribosomal protein S4 [Cyanidium caldarium]Q9TLY7.1 RecName: Full=Small ribosomal subunit protein uS4c-1; AltName: Full=30S ribosomal protein S4, chloroplastic [Cyanidium caldarium]AAF12964.1 unknown [Cyanidium caldarium]